MSAAADVFCPSRLRSSSSYGTDEEDSTHQNDSSDGLISHTDSDNVIPDDPSPDFIHRDAIRSLRLDNLPIGTTVADITASIRGGQVLNIYLRYREKAATVSFVHEHQAKAFYEHVRKHDLYIRSKRIEVGLADQQQHIPGHMAKRIRSGASRNLIIRQCDPYQNADGIREDLEHIHNLIVASIEFRNHDCYIKTNSISGAVYAQTCMSSRQ